MSDDAVADIERAMVAMRRSWTRRTLHRRRAGTGSGTGMGDPGSGAAAGVPGAGDPGAGSAAGVVFQVLDAVEGATGSGQVMTVNGVADALGIDQPRASRLVARAVEAGLVERGGDPDDGRRSVLSLTRGGARVLAEGHRTRREAVEAALAGWSGEDRETFARLLRAYVAAWQRTTPRPRD